MNKEFIVAVNDVAKEKGLDPEFLFVTVEDAIKMAYKKKYGAASDLTVDLNRETGELQIFVNKKVVEGEPANINEVSLDEVRGIDPNFQVGDIVAVEDRDATFGRSAAIGAKMFMLQRIRDAELKNVNTYFRERQNNIVLGIVQRKDRSTVYFDLGKIEGVLARDEQVEGEKYEFRERMQLYVLNLRRSKNGPQVVVSRSHPGLVRRLFEKYVPEILDGTVTIKSVAREPGARSKIAVYSNKPDVDAVGSCVGARGMRIQRIVDELRGEKIDVVKYSENPAEYVANSLSPSKVVEAKASVENKSCSVIVPDYQLSLAIGKEGQNARLAAKLTSWKIDIMSETQAAEAREKEENSNTGEDVMAKDNPVGAEEQKETGEKAAVPKKADRSHETEELNNDIQEDCAEKKDDGQ